MLRGAPAGAFFLHHPDVVILFPLPVNRSCRDEEEALTVGRDEGVGVTVLSGERSHLRGAPAAMLKPRNDNRPVTEIRCVLQKIERTAIGRESRMRFIIAGRDDACAED